MAAEGAKYRWQICRRKGRFVKKKNDKRLEKVVEANQRRKKEKKGGSHPKETVTEKSNDVSQQADDSVNKLNWNDGRRIVELGFLAEHLKCTCGSGLHLCDITEERRYALGSVLFITCTDCGLINEVPTGKHHPNKVNKGVPVFDINTKLAAGMIHSGMGPSHVNSLLTSMNLPSVSERTIKKREREIGPSIEQVAKVSCRRSILHEVSLCRDSEEETVELVASYDMGWQRRSSGRTYNSKSGHGCLIGQETGSIIAYSSRKSTCRICEIAYSRNVLPVNHDCRYNWSGSAKAMEASVGVELMKETHADSHKVKYIVMDDDATTVSHIRRDYDPEIEKWSDINHAKKSLTNKLYSIAKTHKKLSGKVINYLRKCYAYVLATNKNNVEGVQAGLRNIVPHVFGTHDGCGTWCGFIRSGDSYKFKSLPKGQPLSGDDLKVELSQLFEMHALNASRLAPLGSTKSNESFNNIVASKAPKSRHYSSSESFDYRLSAAVCQKNVGQGYLEHAYQSRNLSPGKSLILHSSRMKKKSKRRHSQQSTKSFKTRRLELKENRNRFTLANEVREGPSYETNITNTETNINVTHIPDPVVDTTACPFSSIEDKTLVFFDLETTSTDNDASICQISAIVNSDIHDSTFDRYVLPERDISSFASDVTNITFHDGNLFHNGRHVQAVHKCEALSDFIDFVKKFENVVLIGQNVKSFDCMHLIRVAEECNLLDQLEQTVVGFVDTLPFFRSLYPEQKCHKQEHLVKELLQVSYDAHNALADCKALCDLVSLNDENLSAYSFTFEWTVQHFKCLQQKRNNIISFHDVVGRKVLSKMMAEKCAASGLQFCHLVLAYERMGEDGLKAVLQEKCNGKVRVTSRKQIIEKLCDYISSLQ